MGTAKVNTGFKLDSFKELTQITTKEDVALGIMRWGKENYYPQTRFVCKLLHQSATQPFDERSWVVRTVLLRRRTIKHLF